MRSVGEGDLGERNAEGELEERATAGNGAEEGALDFAPALGEIRDGDQEAGFGVGGQLAAAPESAGGQFGSIVGGVEIANLARGLGGLLPHVCIAPGVEEAAL